MYSRWSMIAAVNWCLPWNLTMALSDFLVLPQVVELPEHPAIAKENVRVRSPEHNLSSFSAAPLQNRFVLFLTSPWFFGGKKKGKANKCIGSDPWPWLGYTSLGRNSPSRNRWKMFWISVFPGFLTSATCIIRIRKCKGRDLFAWYYLTGLILQRLQTSGSVCFAAFMDIDGSDAKACQNCRWFCLSTVAAVELAHAPSWSSSTWFVFTEVTRRIYIPNTSRPHLIYAWKGCKSESLGPTISHWRESEVDYFSDRRTLLPSLHFAPPVEAYAAVEGQHLRPLQTGLNLSDMDWWCGDAQPRDSHEIPWSSDHQIIVA